MTVSVYTSLTFDKDYLETKRGRLNRILKHLNDEFDASLYDVEESEEMIYWEMKERVLVDQLPPFLESQFESFIDREGCDEIIEQLSRIDSAEEIFNLAEEGGYRNFDSDGGSEYGLLAGESSDYFKYSYKGIIYCREGKASMETYHNIFHYFERMIRLQRKEFPIAGAVKIAING